MSEFPRLYDPERTRCEIHRSNTRELTRFVSVVVGLILFGVVLGSLITMFCLR